MQHTQEIKRAYDAARSLNYLKHLSPITAVQALRLARQAIAIN